MELDEKALETALRAGFRDTFLMPHDHCPDCIAAFAEYREAMAKHLTSTGSGAVEKPGWRNSGLPDELDVSGTEIPVGQVFPSRLTLSLMDRSARHQAYVPAPSTGARPSGDALRHVIVPVDLLEYGLLSARTEDGYRLIEIAFPESEIDKGNELIAILSGMQAKE